MAAAFRPVNESALATEDVMTPSTATPRPSTAPHSHSAANEFDGSTTPTRSTFSPSVAGQKPLPTASFPHLSHSATGPAGRPKNEAARQPHMPPQRRDSMDIDMDGSDGETGVGDDGLGSDDESVNADGTRSGKKKKSQRFYCTDYPPCNLSFTRSEHLARHIRKHTGERPFQCHCSRRFSRLDNLRQHAQTVHVNEDIPIDSLAATGSRFQRQIRTDRVRQAGNRARASTGGSAGGPQRGHSKSLSTSSINSISSVGSVLSTSADFRRRPPPLVMADPRMRPTDGFSYYPASPSDFSTPMSATFSTGRSSPRWGSGIASPTGGHSRSQSLYKPDTRPQGRRLSVPSAANPFQPSGVSALGRPLFGGPGPVNSSNVGAFSPSPGTLAASPSNPGTGWGGRRDSTSSNAEEAWRRRTWHPDSYNYAQNPTQLNNVANQSTIGPHPPPPIANPSNTKSSLQLPGIESFDNPSAHMPSTPPRPQPSSMMVDVQPPPPGPPSLRTVGRDMNDDRRNLNVYDASLQRGLNRLDINHSTPPRETVGSWASEANKAAAQAEYERVSQPTVRFEAQPVPLTPYQNGPPHGSLHHHTMSAPSFTTSRESKRRGWYNGPMATHHEGVQRPPQDPRVAHVDRMVHPNFNGFSGFPAREQRPAMPQPPQQQSAQGDDALRRLDVLVAVATGKGSTATAY
ncbi:unnamed protein product [Clonostachys rosea f. rosea IK726]|uniref:C2H2-type domain-containing protein n=3 Tax=Bionectria ochroleuca TaxID=29856 RepID=A0A0B7K0W4_BIOOC|nr:ccp5 [Clonostachys rosea]CAG9956151.1 unnamed protein product [Clonostachys rosea f. rosea IK726]